MRAARRYYGLKPDIKVISPWREWDLNSRSRLIEYAESRGIAVPEGKRGEPPFSTDANLLHISYEGCARTRTRTPPLGVPMSPALTIYANAPHISSRMHAQASKGASAV